MRYLLDSNIFVYIATDVSFVNDDVAYLRANIAKGHKDPWDHMIISHAITERLTLVSSDQRFPFYRRQGLNLLFNEKY